MNLPSPTIGSAAHRLRCALNRNGYSDLAWYPAPHGFFVVTRVERYAPQTGKSFSDEEGRWSPPSSISWAFSLSRIMQALIEDATNDHRMMVFSITTDPSLKEEGITSEDAQQWSRGGQVTLPHEVSRIAITPKHEALAFVYEFRRTGDSDKPIVASTSSQITIADHLTRSGIIAQLSACQGDKK